MVKHTYSEKELISAIQSGGKHMDMAMRWLYQKSTIPREIRAFLLKNGASKDDIDDILQDGICAIIINIRAEKYLGQSSVKTYLHAICKHIWYNKCRREEKFQHIKGNIKPSSIDQNTPEVLLLRKEDKAHLQVHMNELGESCKKVLELWSLNYSMKEIASAMTYKSSGMARKKKHLCLQRLIGIINKDSSRK